MNTIQEIINAVDTFKESHTVVPNTVFISDQIERSLLAALAHHTREMPPLTLDNLTLFGQLRVRAVKALNVPFIVALV
jgi:hypothetical protein